MSVLVPRKSLLYFKQAISFLGESFCFIGNHWEAPLSSNPFDRTKLVNALINRRFKKEVHNFPLYLFTLF